MNLKMATSMAAAICTQTHRPIKAPGPSQKTAQGSNVDFNLTIFLLTTWALLQFIAALNYHNNTRPTAYYDIV